MFSVLSLSFSNGIQFQRCQTGYRIESSQARDLDKLYFHFNASLTTVNIAKIIHLNQENKSQQPFSIADYKLLYHNAFMLNRFIEAFGVKPKTLKVTTLSKNFCISALKLRNS